MRPLTAALYIAGTFLTVAVVYLFVSDDLARRLAESEKQYHLIQSVKGFGFMIFASLGIFGLSYRLLTHLQEQQIQNRKDREALLFMERRVLAGTIATSIVHDAKNLVGAIRSNLQYVEHLIDSDDRVDEALSDSFEAVDELLRLNERLRQTARAQLDEEHVEVDLGEIVQTAVSLIETHPLLEQCKVDVEVVTGKSVHAYPTLITHAVINLVLNAAGAVDGEGHIRISYEDETRGDQPGYATIVVEDDGPGIPEHRREEVLEPFTGDSEGSLGMGLFSVSYCAMRHEGDLVIDRSDKLGGARVRLEFDVEPAVD
ncbi:MAG: sensor histidine kinase [Persicimonas sp.]